MGRTGHTVRAALFIALTASLFHGTPGHAAEADLTTEEREWVAGSTVLRVANEEDWPPFDFREDGVARGYSIDLLRAAAGKVGLRLDFVGGHTWAELMELFKAGEIDILPAVMETPERRAFALFTSHYLLSPTVVVTREGTDDISTMTDLEGRRLALVGGYYYEELIRERYPEIEVVPGPGFLEGLEAVLDGNADAFIGNRAVVNYTIKESLLSGLKIVGRSGIDDDQPERYQLRMAVRKDQETLRSILEKGLAAVSEKEKRALTRKWIGQDLPGIEEPATARDILQEKGTRWLLTVSALFLLGLIATMPIFFRNIRIGMKILIVLTSIATLGVAVNGYIGYSTAKTSLETESFNKLTAVREMKASQVEDYFAYIHDQAVTFSESRTVIEAMRAFRDAFENIDEELGIDDDSMEEIDGRLGKYYEEEFLPRLIPNLGGEAAASLSDYWPGDRNTRILQDLYISSNPHGTGLKHFLNSADEGGSYSRAHAVYHPLIRSYLERFGYYDIFLVDEEGHLVYTVFKEVDYGTSLLTGPYRNTNFARAFRAASESGDRNFVKLEDFEPYHPSYNAPASFIASPIYDGNEKLGVLLFQMPVDRINDIMTNKKGWSDVGLGRSGETYIVGDDFLLRNQSRFLIEDKANYFAMIEEIGVPAETIEKIRIFNSTIGLQEVKTEGTEAALRGESDTSIFPDYRGVPVLSSYKPLNVSDVAWVIMSEIDKEEAFGYVTSLRTRLTALFVMGIFTIFAVSLFFSKSLTRPLQALTTYARTLSQEDFSRESGPVRTGLERITNKRDEIGELARTFSHMEKELWDSIGNLKITTAAKERMESELNIARDIQMSMLPLIFPAFPDHDEFSVHALLRPAREVGGDFYDFYFLDEHHFCFCIGDVSGKGVPAALYMAVTKTLIKARASREKSTASIITTVNEELSRDNPSFMFVTLFLGIMDVRTGHTLYTNAGHNPPFVKRQDGTVERLDARHGPVAGAVPGSSYGEGSTLLSPGDMILTYTDGVTEAMNTSQELFTEKRLIDMLASESFPSPEEMVESVSSAVREYESGAEQADDVTVLALHYKKSRGKDREASVGMTIGNDLSEIAKVKDSFNAFAGEHSALKAASLKMDIVFDEVLSNIISYAYGDGKRHEIDVSVELSRDRLLVRITDDGTPFNPLERDPPDTDLPIEERNVGGLGIHLVRSIMDEVSYERLGVKNVLTLSKRLDATDDA